MATRRTLRFKQLEDGKMVNLPIEVVIYVSNPTFSRRSFKPIRMFVPNNTRQKPSKPILYICCDSYRCYFGIIAVIMQVTQLPYHKLSQEKQTNLCKGEPEGNNPNPA